LATDIAGFKIFNDVMTLQL